MPTSSSMMPNAGAIKLADMYAMSCPRDVTTPMLNLCSTVQLYGSCGSFGPFHVAYKVSEVVPVSRLSFIPDEHGEAFAGDELHGLSYLQEDDDRFHLVLGRWVGF